MIALETTAFGLAWWLGLYLFARDPGKALLRRSGAGLLAYALALASGALARAAEGAAGALLTQLHWLLILLPAPIWCGALIQLLPEDLPLREQLDRAWRYGLAPLTLLVALGAALAGTLVDEASGVTRPGPAFVLLATLALVPFVGVLALVIMSRWPGRGRRIVALLAAGGLFFGLSLGLLAVPLLSVTSTALTLGIGVDLALLAVALARLDALDEGERLEPDMLRAFAGAAFPALLFGGMVGLAWWVGAGAGLPMLALLQAIVAAAVAIQILSDPIAGLLDRLVFAGTPKLRQARAELRESAVALPRVDAGLPLDDLDDAEFAQLTRRALSHYGDLPRLASSPLTRLPIITARLVTRGAPDNPLERAAELKALLAEGISRLKPRDESDFGTSDAWRHYNALYFPYVVGLKPFSQRVNHDHLDDTARQALAWFAAAVPERTLHNWQNAAAKLIAQDLRTAQTATLAGLAANGSEMTRHGSAGAATLETSTHSTIVRK